MHTHTQTHKAGRTTNGHDDASRRSPVSRTNPMSPRRLFSPDTHCLVSPSVASSGLVFHHVPAGGLGWLAEELKEV